MTETILEESGIDFHPVDKVKARLAKHFNWISLTQGPPGCGKSETNLGIADMIDPDFDVAKTVCFTVNGYVKAMKDPDVKVVIFDDAGYGLSSRRFMTGNNQAASVIAQTTRVLGKACLINAPDSKFIDVAVRRLAHTLIEPMAIDRAWIGGVSNIVKWLDIQYNNRSETIYYKFPVIRDKDTGVFSRAIRVHIPRCTIQKVHIYEKMKNEFVQMLLEEADRMTTAKLTKESKMTDKEICKQLLASKELYDSLCHEFMNGSIRLDADLVSSHFDVGEVIANRAIKLIKRNQRSI